MDYYYCSKKLMIKHKMNKTWANHDTKKYVGIPKETLGKNQENPLHEFTSFNRVQKSRYDKIFFSSHRLNHSELFVATRDILAANLLDNLWAYSGFSSQIN